MDFVFLPCYHLSMDDKQNATAPVSDTDAAAKAEAVKKAKAAEAKKRALKIQRDREKSKYFEFYDDVKHDRNKEW